jgi:voltage-gated potassium channel Kch
VNNGIEAKLEELRKGRSFVCEENHTVILGWSPQVFSIVSELVIANASRKRAAIAILADRDKVEMEDDIAAKVPHLGTTRVVCRTGSPIDQADLAIVNPDAARSIIVLAPEGPDPDTHVIKTILALTNNPNRKKAPYHIVAEIRERRNMEAARLVARDEAQLVLAEELLSRITVQTCRQTGLSVVYTELLDFAGDEIYMQEEPSLVGKPFRDALFAYETSAVMGICGKIDGVKLLPPMDRIIEPGDRIIAISADDVTVRLSGRTSFPIDESAITSRPPRPPRPERTLLLGWNRRVPAIIHELEAYVAKGSTLDIVADVDVREEVEEHAKGLENLTVSFERADTTDRRVLDRLTAKGFDHILTLSYDDLETQAADARTLVTLLHLRDIETKRGQSFFSTVSEMLDVRNRQLAEVTQADDFIVSDRLVSLMLSQVSENRDLAAVFEDLFDPEGAELYLKPAGDYVEPGKPVTFYTVLESARRRGEIAVGYRLAKLGKSPEAFYGVKVNPDKSKMVTFSEDDRILVLAES